MKFIYILKKEPVLIISLICAVVSMFAVPPCPEYAGYFDWKVIALLFCLMAMVAGFKKCGLFEVLSRKLLLGEKSLRTLCFVLVMLPFFTSMVMTNDVALITFVPFAIFVLTAINAQKYMPFVITLQTVAANLGSMATPVGNPQSLFIYSKFEMTAGDYFSHMLPLVAASFVFVAVLTLFFSKKHVSVTFEQKAKLGEKKNLFVYAALFVLAILGVFGIVNYIIVLIVTVLAVAVFDRKLFKDVDYCLLMTFVCFFVFAGNIGKIQEVQDFLGGLMEKNSVITSIFASQVISNVPAAVLLSGFTSDFGGLLAGVNIGGLGTIIASLASLISFKYYTQTKGAKFAKYMGVFTAVNLTGIVLLTAVYCFIG